MATNTTATANLATVSTGKAPDFCNVTDGIAEAEALVDSVCRRIGEVARRVHRSFTTDMNHPILTFITRVLHRGDPREESETMEAAKQAEADGLKRRCVW